jgi:hypothetical protein
MSFGGIVPSGSYFSSLNTAFVAPFTSCQINLNTAPGTPRGFVANRFKCYPNNTAMQFTVNDMSNASARNYFREPTILLHSSVAGGSLVSAGSQNVMVPTNSSASTVPSKTVTADIKMISGALTADGVYCVDGNYYMGMLLGVQPAGWAYDDGAGTSGVLFRTGNGYMRCSRSSSKWWRGMTFRMQYLMPGASKWATYDEKVFGCYHNGTFGYYAFMNTGVQSSGADGQMVGRAGSQAYDPKPAASALPLSMQVMAV